MTYDDLVDKIDWAEREVHALRDELLEKRPEAEWDDAMIQDMNDAENELTYLQERLESGDYED